MVSAYVTTLLNEKKLPQTVQIEIINTPPPEAPALQAQKSKQAIEALKKQIVDQEDQALNDETPKDARFLSKNNQVVHKQTIATNRGEFKNQHTKEAEKGDKGTSNTPPTVNLNPKFDIAKSVQEQISRENAFEKAAQDGLVPIPSKEMGAKAQEAAAAKAKGGDASQSLDYIKDLDPGLETLLSTKEFVYYSYFNRIRNQLNQYWTDKVRQKISEMYKKGRMIASSDDKITDRKSVV